MASHSAPRAARAARARPPCLRRRRRRDAACVGAMGMRVTDAVRRLRPRREATRMARRAMRARASGAPHRQALALKRLRRRPQERRWSAWNSAWPSTTALGRRRAPPVVFSRNGDSTGIPATGGTCGPHLEGTCDWRASLSSVALEKPCGKLPTTRRVCCPQAGSPLLSLSTNCCYSLALPLISGAHAALSRRALTSLTPPFCSTRSPRSRIRTYRGAALLRDGEQVRTVRYAAASLCRGRRRHHH